MRLFAACILADLMRVYAPDAPYDDDTFKVIPLACPAVCQLASATVSDGAAEPARARVFGAQEICASLRPSFRASATRTANRSLSISICWASGRQWPRAIASHLSVARANPGAFHAAQTRVMVAAEMDSDDVTQSLFRAFPKCSVSLTPRGAARGYQLDVDLHDG